MERRVAWLACGDVHLGFYGPPLASSCSAEPISPVATGESKRFCLLPRCSGGDAPASGAVGGGSHGGTGCLVSPGLPGVACCLGVSGPPLASSSPAEPISPVATGESKRSGFRLSRWIGGLLLGAWIVYTGYVRPRDERLLAFARSMRRNPTRREELLWWELRKSQLGARFRRQEVIDRYIVDFACRKHRLIVEVDGDSHEDRERDARRDRVLAEQGWRTIRFWDHEVFDHREMVLEHIWNELRGGLGASLLHWGQGLERREIGLSSYRRGEGGLLRLPGGKSRESAWRSTDD